MRPARSASRGFTLVELLVVVAIIGIASAGTVWALRSTEQATLEREGLRLAALLESARAQSRERGVAIVWRTTETGFAFDGAPPQTLPSTWLQADTQALAPRGIALGPEPLIGAQAVRLTSRSQPEREVWVATDGLRPFRSGAAAAALVAATGAGP